VCGELGSWFKQRKRRPLGPGYRLYTAPESHLNLRVFGIGNLSFGISQPVEACGRAAPPPVNAEENLNQLGVIPIQPDGNLRRRFV
jgi:hypothetical protein